MTVAGLRVVDVEVGVREDVAVFVADVALYHLSVRRCHVHERQLIQSADDTSWVHRQLCITFPSFTGVIGNKHGTGSHFVTQRPSDPGIQRPGDPVDPVTLFYIELQMSTYV